MPTGGSFGRYFAKLKEQWRRASRRRRVITLVVSVVAVALTMKKTAGSSGGGTPFGNELVFRLVQLGVTLLVVAMARRSMRR